MTPEEAEANTGLKARYIEAPERRANFEPCGEMRSLGDNWRCQLGRITAEQFSVTIKNTAGHEVTTRGTGMIFNVFAFGPTFEVAISRLRRPRA